MAIISNRLDSNPEPPPPHHFRANGVCRWRRIGSGRHSAGGLGLIGGGYGDSTWLDEQFAICAGHRVGVGFITWSLRKSPSLLTNVLKRRPAAVMLSFGDPRPFVDEIRRADALLICQCQNVDHLWDAIDVEADIIVAQGAEAGGHGMLRGTLSFVPEAADLVAAHSAGSLLVAAGGIADGRGLAAALLGAEGVLVGTRLWASDEALVHPRHHEAIIEATGDDTIRDGGRRRAPNSMAERLYRQGSPQRVHATVARPRRPTGAKRCR